MSGPLPPPPDPNQPGYGYQQQGYGYSYGPVTAYAGFWARFAALLLDGILLGVLGSLLAAISGGSSATGLINLVIGVAYYSYLEGVRGQTVGKMALNIKVVDADNGGVIGLSRGIGRYFARILSALALGLGYFWMLWDPHNQTWHDKLVHSLVVRAA